MKGTVATQSDERIRRPRARDGWALYLRRHPVEGIPAEEIEAHLQHMPDPYWDRVQESELIWALEIIHRFFVKSVGSATNRPQVAVDWRHCPERHLTKVMVCEWDRRGLLAHIAAAFSSLEVNVLRADAYTRGDQVAFDVFEVCEPGGATAASSAKLQPLESVIESRLMSSGLGDPGYMFHPRYLVSQPVGMTPIVQFDNQAEPFHTVLRIEASDRLGLLHGVLEVLAECELNIARALVDTDGEVVRDQFLMTNAWGGKLEDSELMSRIQQRLAQVLIS